MPVWIRILFMIYAFTIAYWCIARIWILSNIEKFLERDYPWYILGLGFFMLFDIVSIVPLAIWFLFFR